MYKKDANMTLASFFNKFYLRFVRRSIMVMMTAENSNNPIDVSTKFREKSLTDLNDV